MNCTQASRRILLPARKFCRAAARPQAPHTASCPRSGSRGLLTGRRALVRPRQAAVALQLLPQGRQSLFWEGSRRGLATETAPDSAFASEHDYHVLADRTLEQVLEVTEQLEEHLDDYESNLSQGVLNLQLGARGTWVLNKQGPNMQIWWSSPISGPLRFEYHADSEEWRTTRDGKELFNLLASEVEQVTGVALDLE